jgi:hypothetical protein
MREHARYMAAAAAAVHRATSPRVLARDATAQQPAAAVPWRPSHFIALCSACLIWQCHPMPAGELSNTAAALSARTCKLYDKAGRRRADTLLSLLLLLPPGRMLMVTPAPGCTC